MKPRQAIHALSAFVSVSSLLWGSGCACPQIACPTVFRYEMSVPDSLGAERYALTIEDSRVGQLVFECDSTAGWFDCEPREASGWSASFSSNRIVVRLGDAEAEERFSFSVSLKVIDAEGTEAELWVDSREVEIADSRQGSGVCEMSCLEAESVLVTI